MAILILENQLMQQSVRQALELCTITVIPALLPFLVLMSPLRSAMSQVKLPFSGFFGNILRIPPRVCSIFYLGLLGGYPLGARCICQAVEDGQISVADARRMLCFCSNCGPAFLFGMGLALLSNWKLCALAFLTQFLSALVIGALTPGSCASFHKNTQETIPPSHECFLSAIKAMAVICLWIILFRVIIGFLTKWVLWLMPVTAKVLLIGLLELSNGCVAMENIPGEHLRLVLFSAILSFGGLCVTMQTYSVTAAAKIMTWRYPFSKLCQSLVSAFFAWALYPGCGLFWVPPVILAAVVLSSKHLKFPRKKVLEIPSDMVYNNSNLCRR